MATVFNAHAYTIDVSQQYYIMQSAATSAKMIGVNSTPAPAIMDADDVNTEQFTFTLITAGVYTLQNGAGNYLACNASSVISYSATNIDTDTQWTITDIGTTGYVSIKSVSAPTKYLTTTAVTSGSVLTTTATAPTAQGNSAFKLILKNSLLVNGMIDPGFENNIINNGPVGTWVNDQNRTMGAGTTARILSNSYQASGLNGFALRFIGDGNSFDRIGHKLMNLTTGATYSFGFKYRQSNGNGPVAKASVYLAATGTADSTAALSPMFISTAPTDLTIAQPVSSGFISFTAPSANPYIVFNKFGAAYNTFTGANYFIMYIDDLVLTKIADPGVAAITSSVSSVSFAKGLSTSFILTGYNLTSSIELSAPVGVTLSVTSLPANSSNVVVTATTGTSVVNGNITITSAGANTISLPLVYPTPSITYSEKALVLEIEKDLKPYPLTVTAASTVYDEVVATASAGYSVVKSSYTPADFSSSSNVIKVEINSTAAVGDTGKVVFSYIRGGISYKLDSVRVTPVPTYTRYYITQKASGYCIGNLTTDKRYPALTAKVKANSQKFMFRRVNPKVVPNDSIYYLVQDGDYRLIRKVTSSNWDTEYGASANEAKWTLKRQPNGVYSFLNSVTGKYLGTDAVTVEGRLYDDKAFVSNPTAKPYSEWIIDDVNALDVDKASLTFNNVNLTRTFTVLGSAVTADVNLVAPSGIQLSKTTITAVELQGGSGVQVTATFANLATITNGIITITSTGQTTKNITINAYAGDASCITPLYPALTNLVADPYLNDLSNFGGWGVKSINTDLANVYCGERSAMIGAGSIDVPLTGIMKPSTTYRSKAMIKATDVACNLGVFGYSSTNTADIVVHPTTTGVWEAVELVFTTGATLEAGDQGLFFNNATGSYIDNWELYEIPTPVTTVAEASVPGMVAVIGESTDTKTISVSGTNLIDNISLAISGTDATAFSVAPASISQTGGIVGSTTVTITYNPALVSANHTATLTVSSRGSESKTFSLSGSSTATGLNQNNKTSVKIIVSNRTLSVVGSDTYSVYNVAGIKVAEVKSNASNTVVSLNAGVYVVRTAESIQKVIVK